MIFSIHPLLSILLSLLIMNGFYNLSKIISEIKYFNFLNRCASEGRIIIFFLVVNFFSIFFYNSFLFFGINKLFLQITIILLILVGFYKTPLFRMGHITFFPGCVCVLLKFWPFQANTLFPKKPHSICSRNHNI